MEMTQPTTPPVFVAPLPRQPAHARRWVVRWLAGATLVTAAVLVALSHWDLAISLALVDFRDGSYGYFIQKWGTKPASLLIVCAAFLLTNGTTRAAHPLAARASAALAAQLLLQSALLSNGLKLLSGRPRPVHLGPGAEGFVPFHQFHPGFGDFSFPSGHVAITMVLAPAVFLLWREGRRLPAFTVSLLLCGWTGAVAFGRVAYGAHFPTDAAFSICLGVAIAPLSLRFGDRLLDWLARREAAKG